MKTEERRPFGVALLAAALLSTILPVQAKDRAPARMAPPEPPVTQLMVKLQAANLQTAALPPAEVARLAALAGLPLEYGRRMAGGAHVLRLPKAVPVEVALKIAERLQRDGGVAYAAADRYKRRAATPDDPRFTEQWHYHGPDTAPGGANLPLAWDVTTGNANIIVAVLDTGLLPHADIDGNIGDNLGKVAPGYDLISDLAVAGDGNARDNDPTDPGDFVAPNECDPIGGSEAQPSSWHGTHVAGTVGALSNNTIGVAGVSWSTRIQPVRVLGKCGGLTSDIIDGVYWAAGLAVPGLPSNPTPAQILNLSLGGDGICSDLEQAAVDAALRAGSVVVVAAGNEAIDASGATPASCAGVITVHAHDRNGQWAVYSNYGSTIEISAPGGDLLVDPGVLSTYDGGTTLAAGDNAYQGEQGTSMAAPHVAGVVALMLAKNPEQTPAEILQRLQAGARAFPVHGDQWDCSTTRCGAGMLDAKGALDQVPGNDTTPSSFSFTDQSGVQPGTVVISDTVTLSGFDAPAPVSIVGGEYSIGCNGSFTAQAGEVSPADTVCVRHTSAAAYLTATTTTLTVGGVLDDFTSTTVAAPQPKKSGGGGGAWSLLGLLPLLLAVRRR